MFADKGLRTRPVFNLQIDLIYVHQCLGSKFRRRALIASYNAYFIVYKDSRMTVVWNQLTGFRGRPSLRRAAQKEFPAHLAPLVIPCAETQASSTTFPGLRSFHGKVSRP